jgi:acyl-homoserine lactone acylase PvdQ
MAIPMPQDYALVELENLHSVVMVRCRAFLHAGQRRDPASIRQVLQAYCDGVVEFVNEVADQ